MLMISTLKNVVLLLNTDRVIKLGWSWTVWEGRDRSKTLLLTAVGSVAGRAQQKSWLCKLWSVLLGI